MASTVWNLVVGGLPAYTRKRRHLQLLRRYGNPGKLLNMARVEMARLRGDIVVRSRPYIYTVDIGNICNLRCPLCPTGYQGLQRSQALMSFEDFQRVLDKIRPYAIEIILHNWGEPFLHPHFLDIVRRVRAAGIGTAASSNMNLVNRDESYLEEVVDAGLDHLVLSIDGTTQEVYEHYRRRGNLEHVLHNVRTLIEYRNARRSPTPVVEWQYLVMKHNEHQIEDARRLAAELGVNQFRATAAGLPFDELDNVELGKQWLSDNPKYDAYSPARIRDRGYLYDEKCFYLYRAMTVNPQGEVAPCCAIHHSRWDFGNLVDSDLETVWNNEFYRSARSLFSKQDYETELETVCHACPLFKYETKNVH